MFSWLYLSLLWFNHFLLSTHSFHLEWERWYDISILELWTLFWFYKKIALSLRKNPGLYTSKKCWNFKRLRGLSKLNFVLWVECVLHYKLAVSHREKDWKFCLKSDTWRLPWQGVDLWWLISIVRFMWCGIISAADLMLHLGRISCIGLIEVWGNTWDLGGTVPLARTTECMLGTMEAECESHRLMLWNTCCWQEFKEDTTPLGEAALLELVCYLGPTFCYLFLYFLCRDKI